MSLTVKQGGKTLIKINDSIRLLPSLGPGLVQDQGALAKLAKDYQVETQKDHFPHYFYLENLKATINYVGKIPEYQFFEPKRTSESEYLEMVQEFKNK